MSNPFNSASPALVLGGSRGMGAAIVRRLARDGRPVAFTYANATDKAAALVGEFETGGGEAIAIKADSADAGAVRDAVAQAVARFGKLGVLVVNAGILMAVHWTRFRWLISTRCWR
jgi:3-oxoacyl-[acyl-carrier protein] reductase